MNKEQLKEAVGELPCVDTVFNSGGSSYIDSAVPVMVVYDLIDQLDEPEVLSYKWISDRIIFNEKEDAEYIYADELQNLLVPKQEGLETKIQELIESYKQEEDAYSNPENGWIGGFIEDLKNSVEKEQKYYVMNNKNYFLLAKAEGYNIVFSTGGNFMLKDLENRSITFELTEQEIKGYDERFWAFAERVEQADFRLSF